MAINYLLTIGKQSVFAFKIKGIPSELPRLEYEVAGGKNQIMLMPLSKLEPPKNDSEFMNVLKEFTKDKGTWNFTIDELSGNFEILNYNPINKSALGESDIVGAMFELFYCPADNDPKPSQQLSVTTVNPKLIANCPGSKNLQPTEKHKLHWIQRVVNNHAIIPRLGGGTEDLGYGTMDNKIDIPSIGQLDPFYDTIGYLLNLTREDYFKDIPTRNAITKDHEWFAELYLAEVKYPDNKPQEVTIYNGIKWGWKNKFTPAKTSKTFSGTLASGYQTDTYKLDQLTPGSKYTAWTNNDLPSNRCNPNTYLSTSSPGSRRLYDDNSSPVGNGFASGLTGTVGNSGTLNLAVQAANGGARGQDKGNYELFVNVYEDGESPTFSNGNSGGGGFGKEMRGLTQQNPILPTSVQNGWQTFSKVPGCRWYDPYTTYGFEFQSLEDTLFTEILDFPVGEDTEFAVTVGNVLLGTFGPGSSIDFVSLLGHGISNFKITGINSLFGSTAETAFPIQLAFNEREGSFKMRAISADDAENVPEPTTVLGTLLAVGGLGIIKKFKNRKTKE
ncbi:PEP-CTERM sorting domain-containing protein [Microcoleus sp. D2B6]|uniref:PEP-CTERM sorting domain-containing protein n=1 Tax=unclassified Microcoleus TaxID=2642155 RepID=UPI002FD379E3